MTFVLVKKDLPRLLRGGKLKDGASNAALVTHAGQSYGVALCFVPGMESLKHLYKVLQDASNIMDEHGHPYCDAGKFIQWDTFAKLCNGDQAVSLEAACKLHLWIDAFISSAPREPRFAQVVEALREVFDGGSGFPDEAFEICLHILNKDFSRTFRASIAAKGGKKLSDVHAFSAYIFEGVPIEKDAKKNVLYYLEESGEIGSRNLRVSDLTSDVVLAGFQKAATEFGLAIPTRGEVFKYGGRVGSASGRSTRALERPLGNLIAPLEAI